MRTRRVFLLFLLQFTLGSCSTFPSGTGRPPAIPSVIPQNLPSGMPLSTHLPGLPIQGENTQMPPSLSTPPASDLQGLIEIAMEDLAHRLSIPVTQINLLESAAVVWPDSGLGCSQPGVASAQVLTPGYLILLGYNNNKYEYHANQGTYVTYCANPTPPILSAPDSI
jgi:hypothetical protein